MKNQDAETQKLKGRAGSPLPAARPNLNGGAHGQCRHSRATTEETRPTRSMA